MPGPDLFDQRLGRVLAGICADWSVEVVTHAIRLTLSVASALVAQKQGRVLISIGASTSLSERTARSILRFMLVQIVTTGRPEDFRVLLEEVIHAAKAS